MNTGEKIRYLRIKNNLTSKELSRILNISESTISLYENDKRKPNIELIVKMADFFNVSTDFLLGVSANTLSELKKDTGADVSELLKNIITLLNNQNYIIFDGKDVDDKTVVFFQKNLNCVLENMRMITGDSI